VGTVVGGDVVGVCVEGKGDGAPVGDELGFTEGSLVGCATGSWEGDELGCSVEGKGDGAPEGFSLGICVGTLVGKDVDGVEVGEIEG